MKLLRNPIAVSVLGVLAIGLVIKSFWPMIQGRPGARRAAAPSAAPAAPTAKPAPVAPAAAGTVPVPAPWSTAVVSLEKSGATPAAGEPPEPSQINLDLVRQDAPRWALGRRDPFQIRSTPTKPVYPRAMEVLNLGAIWRQTDSSLAVLNNHIYEAGDTVLRFVIKSIEPDRVWVQGPNGREVVDFKPTSVLGTNAPANTVGVPSDSPGLQGSVP